ncbi:MAG TPA: glycosyl transferase family 2 [Flavobacteriaceae bacterium]|jgi:glycosyltransferase involved in cell wall biosynthesis|nr:glycosyl transferase family 2 [Flavobacteriaceae bacterium]|tara:strand:- start:103891 stop:104985 length:1095 start_codon:yes stop_codon:yes gene_type:complete
MVLLYALTAVVVINCGYYILFSKFSFLPSSEIKSENNYPVSLIVCAKNEAENLKAHIPLWLGQNHPDFELILIDDASIDETLEVMESFQVDNPKIQIVKVKNNEAFWGNKKYALTLGLKRAKNQRLLFTDADCKPASNNWLTTMTAHFSQEKQLVLGYGAYQKKDGLLNRLIRFETLMTALQYFSYAKANMPYMGVGRNLSYTANLYYENKGFMSHIKLPSGDDDLFVNEAATPKNTAICVAEEAFTYSIPKKTWKAWWLQKKRHITTAKRYKPLHKFLLGLFYTSNFLFWGLSIFALIFSSWKIALAIILFRFLFQYIIVGKAARKLKEGDLIPFIPIFELFLVCYQMSIFISNSTTKQSRWK